MPDGAVQTVPRAPRRAHAPLSEAAARTLMSAWRSMGVWLSVWDSRGRLCFWDHTGPRIWRVLMARSARVREALRSAARRALQRGGDPDRAAAPWGEMLGLESVPVIHRGRTHGVVLAGWTTGRACEDFQRLADAARLDVPTLVQWAQAAPRHDAAGAASWRPLLEAMVHQARELDAAAHQLHAFTRNLDETYEELSLIYSVSGLLSADDSPEAALRRLGEEVRAVARVDAVVVLLAPDAPESSAAAGERGGVSVVSVGRGSEIARADLLTLADAVGLLPESHGGTRRPEPRLPPAGMPPHIIRNHVRQTVHLPASADWVEHVAAFPLVQDGRWLGALLALSPGERPDFSSVEVKFLRAVADRVGSYLQERRLYDDLVDILMGMLHALVSSIDAKDPYTCGHSERVAAMSRRLAQQAGFPAAECQRVYLAGLLHDVGKIGVPDAILCKPGRLTEDEFRVLRKHPEIGARILSRIRQVADLLPGVLHHHERMDGRGYPQRLAGQNIPLLGRLICLADCFDAMTTSRTYRVAQPVELALAEVRRCSGTQFDPALAERFLEIDITAELADGFSARGAWGAPGGPAGGAEGGGVAAADTGGTVTGGQGSLASAIRSWQRRSRESQE